ncbi:MAG: peptidoglycan recognition protein family protein [Planctomycetota bacterium]|jgi:N-acetyl-anhydromuramyl-L-alanine amidase AmpD
MNRLPAAALAAVLLAAAGCSSVPIGPMLPRVEDNTLEAEPGWEPPVAMARWEYIIVHHSATRSGGARRFDKYHREHRGWENGLGYHFVIGNGTDTSDGRVEIGARWMRQITGAHVGGRKNIGKIGICLVGNFDLDEPSPKQMKALGRLIEFLQVRCGIPANRVCGHCEVVRAGYTHCPGRHFSMSELRSGLLRKPPPYHAANVRYK